ncbi:MAG: DmsE family decaheme c-type cytochrome [Psychromonas sp.]|jgi:DmsE family decaheme c-type cytochrome|uniref:DmsE family decaheme c-type cytochrome n=1 Tax=Psychromonas sp. TaxID=1884585 RepID=UPI0039E62401
MKPLTHLIAIILMWLVSVLSFAEAPDALTQQQQIDHLTYKFSAGKYSKEGADSCLTCHGKNKRLDATAIFAGAHGSLVDPNAPMQSLQCETCHGPQGKHPKKVTIAGDKYPDPMLTFSSISPLSSDQKDGVCLACHNDQHRKGWEYSIHQSSEIACVDCHQIHTGKDPMLVKDSLNKACTNCHNDIEKDLHKRSHHPLREGTQQCIDCHTPHSSENPASLTRFTLNDACFDCHAEKRGPFLWEHQPVTEDCSLCHAAHGANNSALLEQRLPQLCQNCHSSAHSGGAITGPNTSYVGGKSCLNCHSLIHGSNHPSGKTLLR